MKCPACGKTDAHHPELAMSYMNTPGSGLSLCECGALSKDGVHTANASYDNATGEITVRHVATKPRRFRYLGFGHFRIERVK